MAKNKGGFIMVFLIMLISVMLICGGIFTLSTMGYLQQVNNEYKYQQAVYLAESGIEIAKALLQNDENWYTDLSSANSGEKNWLIQYAVGSNINIRDGKVKIIREKGKNMLYAVGYLGDNIFNPRARAIVKIEFNLPFSVESWSLI